MHAWSEGVFRCMGACLGHMLRIDKDAILSRRVDMVCVQVLRDLQIRLQEFTTLEVEVVCFLVHVVEEAVMVDQILVPVSTPCR